jgi:hypothetical protein
MNTNSVSPIPGLSANEDSGLSANELDLRADGLRLQWSRWSRCESSFGLLLVPSRPGVFALAEEVVTLDHTADIPRRMLAVFYVGAADDLARTLSQLFAATSPLREKLTSTRCYVRFTPMDDPARRQAVANSLFKWFAEAARAAENAPIMPTNQATESEGPTGVNTGDAAVARGSSPLTDRDPGDEHSNDEDSASSPRSRPTVPSASLNPPTLRAGDAPKLPRPPFPAGF